MPRDQRDRVERLDELRGYLQQSHLSEKNANRLKTLSSHPELFRRAIGVLGIEFFEEVLLDYGDTRGPLWRTVEHFAAPTTGD